MESSVCDGSNSTVVVVVQFDKFIEMDEFAGRISSSSIRPQYLMKAMLAGAMAVDFIHFEL